ncbi:PilW family protein [Nodosilinea sp. PGN35]|uniref:PilW family protein n=1 Tax=Nodosilinea sp. PGN35 TaxID=3020489 RepID=UPI0023B2E89D|nr:prepilin-type N-terminal cleavage/methylation domain-containing protein [Nodosilinea sp. TSF1-S3]MDF0370176.1 prepilin-type N-terminal cleavage/methylation domain-containing protein [Nodosilinea sp. TSF1-S3]
MSSNLVPTAFTRWLLAKSRATRRGFTLIELLVAILVGSVIVGSLLYLIVELLGTNAREERLTQSQQDMRRALDYISRDVREAVYVYSTPADVVNQLTDEPAGTPILAFWRLKPIDVSTLPANCPAAVADECNTLKIRHSVYDLVVYIYRNNSDNSLWSGPGRILRYELTNYSNINSFTVTSGYRDPSKPGSSFEGWQRGTGNTAGRAVVLADFIDNHDNSRTVSCPTNLQASPPDGPTASNNFFVCVRDGGDDTDPLNQSLYVFLRGSILDVGSGVALTFGPRSQTSRLPTINTEVQVRGIIEKSQ